MGCCGNNLTRPATPPARAQGRPPQGSVRLRWRRRATATVTGPVTGAGYRVAPGHPVVVVDARDARGLLETGFFTRVAG